MSSRNHQTPVLKSVVRGLRVLRAVERSADGKQLSELSAILGIGKSTVLRLLRTLVAEGALVHEPTTGRYRPNLASWLSLLPFFGPARSFLAAMQEELGRLAEAAQATAIIALPDESRTHILATISAAPSAPVYVDPEPFGQGALPLHAAASGKCYLAHLPATELNQYLASGLERMTQYTITSSARLRSELRRVRQQGYAVTAHEAVRGAPGLAVPLRDSAGAVVGGLTLLVVADDVRDRGWMAHLPPLREAAERLRELLTYDSWRAWAESAGRSDLPLPSAWDTADPGFGDGATPHVRSVSRMIRLMVMLFRHPEGVSVSEFASQRHVSKMTAFRLLNTLAAEGNVQQDAPEGRYRVSPLLWLRMAPMLRSAASVTAVTEQLLGRLAALTGATACLAFPDREKRTTIAYYYVLPSAPICWHPERLSPPPPLHATAAGKCYLAGQSRLEIDSYIKDGLAALTSNTITTRSRLLRELSDVRKRGYAVTHEETAIGASALAVPVPDGSGAVVAGLVVVPVIQSITEAYVRRWLPELREAADRTSSLLVGDWREELRRPD